MVHMFVHMQEVDKVKYGICYMDIKKLLPTIFLILGIFIGIFLQRSLAPSKENMADDYYLKELTNSFYSCAMYDLEDDYSVERIKQDMKEDGYSKAVIAIMDQEAISKALNLYEKNKKFKFVRKPQKKKSISYKIISPGRGA